MFKIGDKIERTGDTLCIYMKKGKIYTVTKVINETVYFDDIHGAYDGDKFKLVKKTIRDVEVGDLIGNDLSKKYLVHHVVNNIVFMTVEGKYEVYTRHIEDLVKHDWFIQNPKLTITIDGKTYNKSEVSERLSELKTV